MQKKTASRAKIIAGFVLTICVLLGAIITLVFGDISHTSIVKKNNPLSKPSHSSTTTAPTIIATSTSIIPASERKAEELLGSKTYIEVTDGCAEHFQGECLLVRSGPGKSFPVVSKLRTGVVLRVDDTPVVADGLTWYKIVFDEWLRYPERVKGSWYVAADYVKVSKELVVPDYIAGVTPTTTKRIIVDRSKQRLYAYDGDDLFMTATTSTGLDGTPTPRGTFTIYRKTPTRYMQGPLTYLNNDQYYDLPGVPWNLYFTEGGAVIHGAYWHNSFGTAYSHGCVNLLPSVAHTIYEWAPVGTTITVRD